MEGNRERGKAGEMVQRNMYASSDFNGELVHRGWPVQSVNDDEEIASEMSSVMVH